MMMSFSEKKENKKNSTIEYIGKPYKDEAVMIF